MNRPTETTLPTTICYFTTTLAPTTRSPVPAYSTIKLVPARSEEHAILEPISKHIAALLSITVSGQAALQLGEAS